MNLSSIPHPLTDNYPFPFRLGAGKHERLRRDAEEGVKTRGRRSPPPEEWAKLRNPERITAKEYNLWGPMDQGDAPDDEEQT